MQIGTKCFSATYTVYIYKYCILKKFNNPKDARLEMKNWRNWMKIAGLNQLANGVKVKYMNKLETDHLI
jgi:hypothetical protein